MVFATIPLTVWFGILATQSFLAAVAVFLVQKSAGKPGKQQAEQFAAKIEQLEDSLALKEKEYQEQLSAAQDTLVQKEEAFKIETGAFQAQSQELISLRQEYAKAQEELQQRDALIKGNMEDRKRLEAKVSELQAMIDSKDRQQSSALSVLEEGFAKKEQELQQKLSFMDTQFRDIDQLREQFAKAKETLAEAEKARQALETDKASLNEQLRRLQEELSRAKASGMPTASVSPQQNLSEENASQRISQIESDFLRKEEELKKQLEKSQAELALTNKMHEGLKGQYDELEEKFTQLALELEEEKKKAKPSWQVPPDETAPAQQPADKEEKAEAGAPEQKEQEAPQEPAAGQQEQKDASSANDSLDAIKKLLKSNIKPR